MKKTGVNLRVILVIVNMLMAIGSVAAYLIYGENQYVDLTTIGLIAFLMLLNSYWLDWVIIDVVILLASIPIWMFFFASRRTSNAGGAGPKASRRQTGQFPPPMQALERKS